MLHATECALRDEQHLPDDGRRVLHRLESLGGIRAEPGDNFPLHGHIELRSLKAIERERDGEWRYSLWNQEVFEVLYRLFQMTVTDVTRIRSPSIMIAK